jgi:hypothetical protein
VALRSTSRDRSTVREPPTGNDSAANGTPSGVTVVVEVLMYKRYILNTSTLVAAVVALVASRVFTGSALEWLTFGLSAVIAGFGIIGLSIAQQRRHTVGFGVLTAVAAWSLVAALVFTGGTLAWLALADSIALAVIALGALALHELSTERVVHTLEVREEVAQTAPLATV